MRFSTTYTTAAALAIITPGLAQYQSFSGCVSQCGQNGAPVGGCLGGSDVVDVEYCDCRPELDLPNTEAAECLLSCADEFDEDYTQIYDESCQPLFEGMNAETSSAPTTATETTTETSTATTEETTASPTGETTGSGTEEPTATGTEEPSESESDDPNRADNLGFPALVLAGGLAVALF